MIFNIKIYRHEDSRIKGILVALKSLVESVCGKHNLGYQIIKKKDTSTLNIKIREYNPNERNIYPIDVISPLIEFKMKSLPEAKYTGVLDWCISYNQTFDISLKDDVITIKPTVELYEKDWETK